MGYSVFIEDGEIRIKKENMIKILYKLADYFEDNELDRIWGFTKEEIKTCPLIGLWSSLRYSYIEFKDYYIVNNLEDDVLGDDEIIVQINHDVLNVYGKIGRCRQKI